MVQTTNCGVSRPFIALGAGEAPTLDYNIPQQSCISALGRIALDIPESWFLDSAASEPENHWWKIPHGDLDDIRKDLHKDITYSHGGLLLDRKVADVVRSGEERIAAADAAQGEKASFGIAQTAQSSARSGASVSSGRATGAADLGLLSVAGKNTSQSRVTNSRSWNLGVEETAQAVHDGFRPIATKTLGGAVTLQFIPQPVKPRPRLYLVEEYRVCSYLADYGAGKTISNISLLPGEKRNISLRTYRDSTTTKTDTENILDSFSQESADEFEELIESESGFSTSSSSSSSTTNSGDVGLSVGLDLFNLVEVDAGGGFESSGTQEASTTQETYVDTLSRAFSKHVEQSSYKREVEVNTTTSETVSEGEEESVTREIANINQSRVLNFVVRQLLQKYVTITYLHSVRVVYTNGYPESITPMELYALDEVLPQFISEKHLEDAKAEILKPYCTVFNYKQEGKRFIEKVDRKIKNCEFLKDGEKRQKFYRKDPNLADEAEGIEVPGVIKKVQFSVLRTPAVIIDALMGQGESLDCYNQELQAAAVNRSHLNNAVTQTALEIVGSYATPRERTRAYVKLLRECECQTAEEVEAGEESEEEPA